MNQGPLRVLLTTDVVGGVWDFTWSLARELTRGGHTATLLALGQPTRAHYQQAEEIGVSLLHAPLKLEWMQDSAADTAASRCAMERAIQEQAPDIVHVSQFVGGLVDSPSAPVVLTAHSDVLSWQRWTLGVSARPPRCQPQWARYAALVRKGLARADAVVAVSSFLAGEIQRLYGVERPVRVIHNGWPQLEQASRAEKAPRPLAQRDRLSVLVGRAWDSAKNLDLAVQATRDWSDGRIILLGGQQHPETGEVVFFEPPVEALGWVLRETVAAYLRRARVYVAPARYDPFGLVPVQAALAGCALLLSDIPSYRELWDGAALFFPCDDAQALRACWQALLRDEALATEIARRSKQRAEERFSAQRLAGDYLHLYRTLLRNRHLDRPATAALLAAVPTP